MADTVKTQTAVLASLADNNTGKINPQVHRDAVVSARANQGGGWAFYSDSVATTQGTAQTITGDERTKMLCDGLGAFTAVDQLQSMTPAWLSNALMTELNCAYVARMTFKAQIASAAVGHFLTVELDIGAGGLGSGPVVWSATEVLIKGANVEQAIQYSIPIFAKAAFVANGGTFFITSDVDADIWDMRVFLNRTYMPDN